MLEYEGDRVFIEQDNGAELDFQASDLTATPPASSTPLQARMKAAAPDVKPASYAMPNRVLTATEITPEHVRVLGAIPVRTVQAVATLHEQKAGG